MTSAHMLEVINARILGLTYAIIPGCPDSLWVRRARLYRIAEYLAHRVAR